MSLFSKKKAPRRQFRKKVVHSLEEDEESTAADQPSEEPVTQPTAPTAPPANVPKSLLSFNDEELGDGTEFKVKKSNHTKRVARKLEQQRRKKELEQQVMEARMERSSDSEEESALSSISHRISAGVIPDSNLIHAARKQREMARKMGTQPAGADFMPLDSNAKKESGRAKGKSRLVREDEYDKSDESEGEEQGRFGKRREVPRQMQVLTAMEEAGSGSDEERFVEEQINKAVKGCVVSESHPTQPYSMRQNGLETLSSLSSVPTVASRPPINIPETLVPITVETLKSRLSQQLSELRSFHSQHTQRLEEMEGDLLTADREIGGLEDHINTISLEYQFYQETRGYLRDLLSCLSEKVPVVEELAQSLHSVLGNLTELRVERRRQDMRDMSAECVQATPIDDAHKVRIVEREGRQRRRREARRERGVVNHYDGTSSDDEILETNKVKFKSEIDALLSKREDVFSDVKEEFSELSSVKSRLEQWKFSFPSSYSQAYISLCLPKLFSPFVRLELLSWNPVAVDCGAMEDCRWFQVLMFYGFLEGEEPERDDEDLLLLPRIVEKVVLPKLTALVKSVWDPLSSAQTSRLVSLIRTLFEDYPTLSPEEKEGLALMNALTLRLRQTIDADVFIPLFSTKQLESPISPRSIFHHRQYWSCLKLLSNVTKWVGLIDVDTLQEIVLDGLVNRYLLLSLQNSPASRVSADKVAQLVALLPVAWYSDGSIVTRPLEGLVRYIIHLVDCLNRAAAGSNDVERNATRSSIYKLACCLKTVGAHAQAETVAKQHNLKDLPPKA